MGLAFEIKRRIGAPREAVFGAFSEPEKLAGWWGPKGFTIPSVEMDLRAGGRYRFAMQPPEGDVLHLSGEIREVEPPSRLVYTFVWEPPDPDDRETVATMTFGDLGDATELVVRQEGFATEARRALHVEGWTDSLAKLQELMSSPGAV